MNISHNEFVVILVAALTYIWTCYTLGERQPSIPDTMLFKVR